MKKRLLLSLICLSLPCLLLRAQVSSVDFYQTDVIQQIRITLNESNWQYVLDSLYLNGKQYLTGSVEINGQRFEGVGVRFRGTKSFQPGGKRNGLYLKLNHRNRNQAIQGYNTIKLSSALRDPSMIREVLGYEIARNYLPTPKANFAQVYINNQPYGLLVNVESIEEPFLQSNFGDSNGPLFQSSSHDPYMNYPSQCKQNIFGSLEYDHDIDCYFLNWEKKSATGWDDLIELTRILEQEPEKINSVLNVDRTLWMLAYNNVLVNLSSYTGQHSQNYYFYKDKFGQFNPILWDLNLNFGSFKNVGSGSDLKLKQLQELDPLLHIDNPTKPLISKLLENEWYRKVYLSHVRTIVYEQFSSGKYEQRAKELQNLIQLAVVNDPNKLYTFDDFNRSLTETIGNLSRIPGIVELMSARTNFLKRHKDLAALPPAISDTKVLTRSQFSSRRVDTFRVQTKVDRYPKRVKLMYRFSPDEPFREVAMSDDGQNNDGEANDGIYGVIIAPQSGQTLIEYYVVAEGATMVSFDPPSYMWKQHRATLEDINR
jgi:hypothetical protein